MNELRETFESFVLPFTLKREGGFVNDPADSGGATNRGVTQDIYDRYRKSIGQPKVGVNGITMQEVSDIYFNLFWKAYHCYEFPYPFSGALFDFSVTSGANAIKVAQRLVGFNDDDVDGIMGLKTIGAVQALTRTPDDTLKLTAEYLNRREDFYRNIGINHNAKFLQGWLNRVYAQRELFSIK